MFDINQTTKDYMSLVLTHECNKKCPFCVDKYRGSGETISIENVKKAISFGKEQGIKDMLLIGGEPTIHPKIDIISSMVKDAGFRVIMTTNYTKPEIVRSLDGVVDCFNISFYNQKSLPKQKDFKSDLTLHTLIHAKQIKSVADLDNFINSHRENGHLKFSTLLPCNDWAKNNQTGSFLDSLDCNWIVLFNEILGQEYKGCVIKRYDRVINKVAHQSFKAHVNGEISTTWERNI